MAKTIDGTIISDELISFDPVSYRFTANDQEITAALPQSEKKRLVGSSFDVTKDLYRMSALRSERRGVGSQGMEALPTSTASYFFEQIVTDPLAAPRESLGNQVNEIFANSGIRKLLIAGVVVGGLGLFLYMGGGQAVRSIVAAKYK
jgi:hypothetical protein